MLGRAYTEYRAYVSGNDASGAEIAWHVYSHELDVAHEYIGRCADQSLWLPYYLGDLRRELRRFPRIDSIDDKQLSARLQGSSLKLIYSLGYASAERAEYAALKAEVASNFREVGMEFRSPETAKVLVKSDATTLNCRDNDRAAQPITGPVVEAPARLRQNMKFHADLYVMIFVSPDGTYKPTHSIFPVNIADHKAEGDIRTLLAIEDAIAVAVNRLTYKAAVRECRPTGDIVYFRFEVFNGVVESSAALREKPQ